jgi:ubiquinone/menaquinone biosynthesis C-methylase UbiE
VLSTAQGPDPYFAYKIHHVMKSRTAWTLCEEFGIYEALRDGPATALEVSQRVGLQERPVAAMLASSAFLGILEVDGDRYSIYDIMREMVLEGGYARTVPPQADPKTDFFYRVIKKGCETNAPAEESFPPWLRNPSDEEDETAHAPGRHGWRVMWGRALASAFDFTPYKTVADIGGATGGVLVGLTGMVPHIEGVVVDLPYARKTAEGAIRKSGAGNRVRFHAADVFNDPLPAVDVFFMSHVIHDWDDETCVKLLYRVHDALPSGCPVLVQKYLLNDDKTAGIVAVIQWFNLMYGTTGDQRNGAEIQKLMRQAGFASTENRPIDNEQSIVIGWKG